MAENQSGEKTEQPTDRKLEESRKKGSVWKSRDLSGVLVLLGGFGILKFYWPHLENKTAELFGFVFKRMTPTAALDQAIGPTLIQGMVTLAVLTLPFVAGAAIVGGLTDFIQTGGLFAPEALTPKFEKLNPVEGFKNIFSQKQLVELAKSTAKIFAGSYVAYGAVRDGAREISLSPLGGAEAVFGVMGDRMFQIALRLGILFLVFAIFDVWWQRHAFLKDMKMTKDEVKREFKETEGDPHFKNRRKEIYQEILENLQLESVKEADVVVTNPDHVAVALKYNREKDGAPRVIAKGLNLRAEAIKKAAREADVTLLRNVPLAHALLRVDIGEEIPESLYDAVAEVLNFVYSLKAQAASR